MCERAKRASASESHYFLAQEYTTILTIWNVSANKNHSLRNIVSTLFHLIWRYKQHTSILRKSTYGCQRSKSRKKKHFLIPKLTIFSQTWCWKFRHFTVLTIWLWHVCQLTMYQQFPNVPIKLWKSIIGEGLVNWCCDPGFWGRGSRWNNHLHIKMHQSAHGGHFAFQNGR